MLRENEGFGDCMMTESGHKGLLQNIMRSDHFPLANLTVSFTQVRPLVSTTPKGFTSFHPFLPNQRKGSLFRLPVGQLARSPVEEKEWKDMAERHGVWRALGDVGFLLLKATGNPQPFEPRTTARCVGCRQQCF